MGVKVSDIEEYTEAVIEISEGLTSDVLDAIGYDFEKRSATLALLTCYCLILTYKKMDSRKVGFLRKRKVINEIVASMATQNMMSTRNIPQYKITFKFLLRLFGQLTLSAETHSGSLAWEYAKYMVEQIGEDEDLKTSKEVHEKLIEINKNLKTDYLVNLIS
ncbi:MAG: hypothetical protein WBP12_03135 [Candidatus Saccharimonas sp.]